VGLLDLSSVTDRTIPVMVDPVNVNVAFSPRYWAYRQRLASFGSVVSIVCMILPKVAVRKTVSATPPQSIPETLSNDSWSRLGGLKTLKSQPPAIGSEVPPKQSLG
jgi:hypothetical protein